jgi:Domain of unknown function (DUF4783)
MKTLKTLIAFLIALFFAIAGHKGVKAQSTPDETFAKIASAIRKGDAEGLTAFFQSPLEITLPGADEAYSSQQATFVLKDFFTKNAPKSFAVIHKGNSGTTDYATGSFVSSGGTYDTNIFLKKVDGTYKVTLLRFEAE